TKDLKQTYDQASSSMQKIVNLADKNGLKKEDVSSGVLTVRPYYEGDRKKKAKSFYVHTLRVRDFSKLGPILEGSVEDGITDFRSLTYSLSDEEAAKQKAVAAAMKHALGRATAALESKGQKVGGLRFANIDVKQLTGLQEMNVYAMQRYAVTETVDVSAGAGGGWGLHKKASTPPPAPPPVPQPEKISVSASVQCAFQIL
ncbi:MAG: SIMPL domain-containing protein, partial [Candidatus Acidiferrum sp.]